MKTFPVIAALLMIFIFTGCKNRKDMDIHVQLGLFTPYFYTPEILNGRVIVIKEELKTPGSGKEVQTGGRVLTPGEISEMDLKPDYTAYFDTTGMIVKVLYPEKGEGPDHYWLVEPENGNYQSALWKAGDSTIYTLKFVYDSNGNLLEARSLSPEDHSLKSRETFRYGENGHIIEYGFYQPADSLQKKILLKWDQNDHVINVKFYDNAGTLTSSRAISYNEQGFMSKKLVISSAGDTTHTITYTYEYDVMGNWVKKVRDDGVRKLEADRTYTYR